jgi:PAS domain S-box-containing protein
MTITRSVAAGLARLWPRRLRHQLLLVVSLVLLLSCGLLYPLSGAQIESATRLAAQGNAQRVADATAAALGTEFLGGPGTPVPAVLRAIGALPGLHSLTVERPRGQVLRAWRAGPDGLTELRGAPSAAGADAIARPNAPGNADTVTARAAVNATTSLAVVFSTELQRAELHGMRTGVFLVLALLLLLTAAAVHAWLRHALKPLHALARFAAALGDSRGTRLSLNAGSAEMQLLAKALDDASTTLHAQWQALRDAEERTAAILNAAPDALIGLDSAGRVAVANPAVTSVLGLEPDQALGLPLEALLVGVDAAEAERRTSQGLYMRSSHTRVARFELNARRHDGTEFPAEVSLSRVDTAAGARYACVVRDVTEQRMTFSMLNLYSQALECATNGVVISDMTLPGNPVFYANPAFYRITGFDPGEAIGRNCAFLQGDDTAQPELDVLRAAIRAGEPASVVLRNYRKDGRLFFNELSIAPVTAIDGRVQHYVGILNDVTERERSRLAIAERSARLNAVFDLSPDGFVVFDRRGMLVYTNRAFNEMTGLHLDPAAVDITLAAFDDQINALCDTGATPRPLADALADETETDGPETLMLVRPERRVLARVVRGGQSAHGESILFFRDITRESEVDRMKSEFLTTAAHELRTPMVSVFGFTELLLNRPVGEERRRDMLTTIHRQASLLIKMVNELLDLARIEARQGKDMKPQSCNLGGLLELALAPFAQQHGPQQLRLVLDHPEARLWVDPEKMNRVFANVLSNAFKYSPEGGPVDVSTIDGTVRGQPAVGVRVRDRGIGMSEEQVRRVFERFYRADPSGNIPGTGLGMSLVKEITELQDGQVQLESRLGEGTTVTMWFPLQNGLATSQALSLAQPE